MSSPRQVLPGSVYLVTRRCAQRQFLLQPTPAAISVFLYVLAVAARRYGIDVHAFCVLSNHYHLVVTDPRAQLPAFQQFLDALVARALNASLGRWEAFWAPNTYSAVMLSSAPDIVEKVAYVLANPVTAGLVATGSVWPGLWSSPERIGGERFVARRPKEFFDPNGPLPEEVELQLTVPNGCGSADDFRRAVHEALDAREARARATWTARGGFAGVRRVLAQKPTARSASTEPHRRLNPRIAARDKWKRIEVLERLREFLDAYRAAWVARRAGQPNVVFPAGTYLLRVAHGVACAASG